MKKQTTKYYGFILGMITIAIVIPVVAAKIDHYKAENGYQRICSLDSVTCDNEEEVSHVKTVYGVASWYDYTLDSGWSSVGHRVCASRDFPRKSYLLVTDLSTGKRTTCTVTDYIENPDRIIDLSSTAFSDLKPLKYGLIQNVSVQLIW